MQVVQRTRRQNMHAASPSTQLSPSPVVLQVSNDGTTFIGVISKKVDEEEEQDEEEEEEEEKEEEEEEEGDNGSRCVGYSIL